MFVSRYWLRGLRFLRGNENLLFWRHNNNICFELKPLHYKLRQNEIQVNAKQVNKSDVTSVCVWERVRELMFQIKIVSRPSSSFIDNEKLTFFTLWQSFVSLSLSIQSKQTKKEMFKALLTECVSHICFRQNEFKTNLIGKKIATKIGSKIFLRYVPNLLYGANLILKLFCWVIYVATIRHFLLKMGFIEMIVILLT